MSTGDDMPDWESQEDVIIDHLTSASQELSQAKGELLGGVSEIKSALILILSVRNIILGVLQEHNSEALTELQRECEYDDIDDIMRAAYLALEFDNTEFAFYMVHRYQGIIGEFFDYFGLEDENSVEDENSLDEEPKNTDDGIGFVSYGYSKEQITKLSSKLELLDRVFRFNIDSVNQRKMYACDFILSLEKLRTIFGDMFGELELGTGETKVFEIFNTAFLWGIDDIGEVVADIIEFGKSEDVCMMVARLLDMSRKMIDYCDSLDSSILQGPFIGIEDMSELDS